MPHLTIKGTNPEKIQDVYKDVMVILSETSQADIKYVKVECIPTTQFGEEEPFLKLEVLWLSGRSQEVQDNTAKALTEFFKLKGYNLVFVTFTNMPATDFYENAVHY